MSKPTAEDMLGSSARRAQRRLNTALGAMRSDSLVFSSQAFAVIPGEDEATNPGVYGKALATWLAQSLREKGVASGEVIAEDFGWCVPVASKPHRTYVACANDGDASEQWQAFVFAEGGLFSRILGKDTRAVDVNRTFSVVKALLEQHSAVKSLRVEREGAGT